MEPGAFVIVTTTVESEADARRLATELVEQQLAACVQIEPVESVYRWKGSVETAREWRLNLKTRQGLTQKVCGFLRTRHSYEVPEILVTPILDGHPPYLRWLHDSTGGV